MVKKVSTRGRTDSDDEDDVDRGGAPEHYPTEDQRNKVQVLSQYGVKQRIIAVAIGISPTTLKKHYSKELLLGEVTVQTLIGQTSLRVALGSPAEYYPMDHARPELRGKLARAEVPPDGKMLMFFCKTRLGMTPILGVADMNPGKPDDLEFNTAGLTESERVARLVAIFDSARARGSRSPPSSRRPVGAVPGKAARGRVSKRG